MNLNSTEYKDRQCVSPKLSKTPDNKLILALTILFSSMATACTDETDRHELTKEEALCEICDKCGELPHRSSDPVHLSHVLEDTLKDCESFNSSLDYSQKLTKYILETELASFYQSAEKLKPLLKQLRENRRLFQTKDGIENMNIKSKEGPEEEEYHEVKVILDNKHDVVLIRQSSSKANDKEGGEQDKQEDYVEIIRIQDKHGKPVMEFKFSDYKGFKSNRDGYLRDSIRSYCSLTDYTRTSFINPQTLKSEPVVFVFNYYSNESMDYLISNGLPGMDHASSPYLKSLIEDVEDIEALNTSRYKNINENLPPEIADLLYLLDIQKVQL